KQGSCNVDTVCSEADAWRNEVRSIVMYTLNGIDRCTGVMINNTAQDSKPYMLTAEHCSFGGQYPDVTTYFNFESPTCGALSGGVRNQSVNGATLRAIDEISDYALLELDSAPPAAFGAYYSGWDITNTAMPGGVAAIHHPSVDEKAISFENDPVFESPNSDPWPSTHWRVDDWDVGTTEPGSSGSPIFNQANKLVVGTLSGGFAACGNNESDWYGKMSEHMDRGLRNLLDPLGTGQTTLAGMDPNGSTPSCVESATVRCLNNDRFAVSIEWKDFEGGEGVGTYVEDSDDSSLWWFFTPTNWEMLVKVLDGCGFNDRFWVFAAAVTNVEFTLTVTDTVTEETRTWTNPLGVSASAITDTDAFATCP
ncbi:MAG: serine protease, partial [Acidobacteriota bacterium]